MFVRSLIETAWARKDSTGHWRMLANLARVVERRCKEGEGGGATKHVRVRGEAKTDCTKWIGIL